MKYSLFNNTKMIELDDELVEVYESCIHSIDPVSLQGMIAACKIKEEPEQEISRILTNEMLDSLEIYKNKDEIIQKIKEQIIK